MCVLLYGVTAEEVSGPCRVIVTTYHFPFVPEKENNYTCDTRNLREFSKDLLRMTKQTL